MRELSPLTSGLPRTNDSPQRHPRHGSGRIRWPPAVTAATQDRFQSVDLWMEGKGWGEMRRAIEVRSVPYHQRACVRSAPADGVALWASVWNYVLWRDVRSMAEQFPTAAAAAEAQYYTAYTCVRLI